MLFLPLLAGAIAGLTSTDHRGDPRMWLLLLSIACAWVLGYFCFFACGLWFKARNAARKASYLRPTLVYGCAAAAAAATALIVDPQLLVWAIFFAPLVAVAMWEVYKNRPRSMASGVSTTVASSLMFPVMISATDSPWVAATPYPVITTIVIALYFIGTVFYIKSIIRKKGNLAFYRNSIIYQSLAFLFVAISSLWMMTYLWFSIVSGVLAIIVMALSLVRAVLVPQWAAKNPQAWTPRKAGLREIPLTLMLGISCCLIFVV